MIWNRLLIEFARWSCIGLPSGWLRRLARRVFVYFVLCATCATTNAYASVPPWTNIISAPRAIDWRNSGPQISFAGYTQCTSIAPYTGTAATINTALAGCSPSTYVLLQAGTFTLSTGILLSRNGVMLVGVRADLTIVNFTSAASQSCNGFSAVVCIFGGDSTFWIPGTGITVTGGLTQGSTSITVSSATGISVGKAIVINSADTGKTGVPCTGTSTDNGSTYNTGDQYSAGPPASGASFSGPDSGNGTPCRFSSEVHTVTGVSGTTITLGEPIEYPTWNSPQAWTFTPITGAGVMNIGFNVANGTSAVYGIGGFNICNSLIQGNAFLNANVSPLAFTDSCHNLVQFNYGYSAQSSDNFGVHITQGSDDIIHFNVLQQFTVGTMCEGPCSGEVIAYNYYPASCNYLGLNQDCISDDVSQMVRFHSNGDNFNLVEGNIGTAIDPDGTHGTHLFNMFYRNLTTGWESCGTRAYCTPDVAKDFLTNCFLLYSLQARYSHLIANACGTVGYHTGYIYTSGQTNTDEIGMGIDVSGGVPPPDSIVGSTTMLWGNYDVANATVRWVTSEVPSSISVDPNAIPTVNCTASSPACPASFYLPAQPAWWPSSKPFPAIGPDVSSGNLGQCSGTLNVAGQFNGLLSLSNAQCGGHGFTPNTLGGHANSTPAMDCFLNIMGGPLDGTGAALTFNASACFPTAQVMPPAPATNMFVKNHEEVLHLAGTR